VRPLIESLFHTLASIEWEAIFVDDDSLDGTAALIREVGRLNRRVRVIQRIGRHGLASACIEGMLATPARYLGAMDTGSKHDESILPIMLDRITAEKLDLVIGSRNAEGGSMGDFTRGRVALSRLGSRLSRGSRPSVIRDPLKSWWI